MFENTDAYVGPAAGVATSVLWTATSLLFTAAGRRLGPVTVNAVRIVLAIALLAVTLRLRFDIWLPDALARQVVFLAISGIVGLSIGDQALFTAFVDIGPRLTVLIMTTSPLFAAFFGWIALDESLSGLAWVGIALTLGGIAWVVMGRPPRVGVPEAAAAHHTRGLFLAFVGAACQAGGLLLSKQGMGHGWLPEQERMNPQAATLVRMIFAGVGMVPIVMWHRARRRRTTARRVTPDRSAWSAGMALTFAGAVVGPYLGVWMSLVAADGASLGVAQTLCSLSPIFILPCVALLYKERVSARAVLGALVTVGGAVLLIFGSR
ncbi:MAG: DMT family transporter [Planctomycetes bacterium]|nr:DMT family transporter [Planctomycetota bacterium]